VRQQAVLQVNGSKRRRKLPKVAGGRADETAQLAKGPMCGRNRFGAPWHHQGQAPGIVTARLDQQVSRFDGAHAGTTRPRADCVIEGAQGQVTLVIRPEKPFGRYATNPLAPRDIDIISRRDRHA